MKRNLKKHPSGFFIDVDAHQAWIASLPLSVHGCPIMPAGQYMSLALMKIGRYNGVIGLDGRIESSGHDPIWVQNAPLYTHDDSPILFNRHKPRSHVAGRLLCWGTFFANDGSFIPEQFLVSPARLALEAYAAKINGGV
jgi:hypothetical protein